VIDSKTYPSLKLKVQELSLIYRDLKISKSRALRAYQNLLVDNIKPAHPDAVRVLKAQMKNDISRLRQKLVRNISKKLRGIRAKKEEEPGVVLCIQEAPRRG
jgi:hypothetical protein